MLAVVGCAALVWHSSCRGSGTADRRLARVLVTTVVGLRDRLRSIGAASCVGFIPEAEADRRATRRSARPTASAGRCGDFTPSRSQPAGRVMTFVDLGPRLITVDPPRRGDRPISSQRTADRRRDELLARIGGSGACARAQVPVQLRAELPRQLDDDDLHIGGAERLLRPAAATGRCRTGSPRCSCPRTRRTGCGRSSAKRARAESSASARR